MSLKYLQLSVPSRITIATKATRTIKALPICLSLAWVLLTPSISQAAESYSTVVSKHLALESKVEGHSTSEEAEDPAIADLKRALMDEVESLPQPQGLKTATTKSNQRGAAVSGIVLAVAGLLILGTVGYLFKRRFDSLLSASELAEQRAKVLLADDPSLAAFFNELRDGMSASGAARSLNVASSSDHITAPATDLLGEFFASVPDQLAHLRKLFSDLSRAVESTDRQGIVVELLNQTSRVKDLAEPRELRPVWLVTCALEGLFKQLSRDASEVTVSVLRTVAGALDLLDTLCVRGLNPNLATEPPVQLLAVDDDPVSRLAMSYALKKSFESPDLASDGEAALAMAEQKFYDVVFLDVDMPGMDGYELCTRIRQTPRHKGTPVVFVTRHGDFNSRARSTLSGGECLIAKPFLAFEITVKALTLALRSRLQQSTTKALPEKAAASTAANEAPAAPAASTEATATPDTKLVEDQDVQVTTPTENPPDEFQFVSLTDPSEPDFEGAFFTRAIALLEQLREQLVSAQHAANPAEFQKYLGRLCDGTHTLNAATEQAELRAAARLGSALEGMFRKLRQHPQLCSPSAFNAASAALELLESLCSRTGTQLDLTRSTVRILVVDDDPIARRAISGSIQLVFGRPDNAEHGEAAVALADEKPFDLVFLDVLMPGIDGFAACRKIHRTPLNQETPVVFITSHDDAKTRAQAVLSGGCGLIPKPVLASQITLTALTFILRARFNKIPSPNLKESPALVSA